MEGNELLVYSRRWLEKIFQRFYKSTRDILFIGAGSKEKGIIYPHHHPRFTIDEDALPIGVQVFVSSIMNFISKGE